ncbi:MAG: hypothetical protein ACYTAO_21155 [Planctomycetota bacterium]|jgi:hypothetical protein
MTQRTENTLRIVAGLTIAAFVVVLGWAVAVQLLGCATAEDVLSPHVASPASAVATGDDSSVFVWQSRTASGLGGLLCWSFAMWYYGRRTPVNAAKRMMRAIELQDVDKNVRNVVRALGRRDDGEADAAERWINKQVKANRKGTTCNPHSSTSA